MNSVKTPNFEADEFILLDDNDAVHYQWKISRKENVNTRMYFHSKDLKKDIHTFSKESSYFFIDYTLQKGDVTGLNVCGDLLALGFRNVILNSFHMPSSFCFRTLGENCHGLSRKIVPWESWDEVKLFDDCQIKNFKGLEYNPEKLGIKREEFEL